MDLAIGRIAKVHGVHGGVIVDVRTDSPEERFVPGESVRLAATKGAPEVRYTIASVQWHGSRLFVKFNNVSDRDEAQKLRGRMIIANSSELHNEDLDEDEFHDTDLMGLKVQRADGTFIGSVTDVLHTAGGEILVVRVPEVIKPGREGKVKEVLIPFVRTIVTEVNVAEGTAIVDPPDGLLDL